MQNNSIQKERSVLHIFLAESGDLKTGLPVEIIELYLPN